MATRRKGKLELDWVDKGDIILTKFDENGKTYPASYFQGQVSDEELMPRELELIETVGDPNSENMLIWGENMIALRSLEREFAGRIKLIYIDPPFNTGQDFEDYEDGLEHSIWLSMMENRLRVAEKLLSDEGMIFVHIDENQQAYLKILLDSIFKPTNYVNEIIWKKTNSPKAQSVGLGNQHDVIYFYAKDKTQIHLQPFYIPIDKKYKKSFSYDDNDGKGPYQTVALIAGGMQRTPTRKEFEFRGVKAPWLYSEKNLEIFWKEGRIYKTKTGSYRLKKYLSEIEGKLISDIWIDDKVSPIQGSSSEYRNFQTQKPESLIMRIIKVVGVDDNEYILDFFAGSGTTGAVAHKIGKKWIMIENREYQSRKLSLKRLKDIVFAKDSSGITKEVGWKGGGGFKFYKIGEPLIIKHKDYPSIKIINPKYYNTALIKVICNIERFKFRKDDKLFQGVNKLGNKYAHVTEQYVSQGYMDFLKSKLADKEELIIYCFNYDEKITLPFNIIIKKLPRDIGREYQLRFNYDRR